MKTNNKDIIREFFKSKTRFLAIFIINLLGISTFIGLNVLSKDMYRTIDDLYKISNVADVTVSSNIALNQGDLRILNNLEYISDIEYGYNEEIYINNTKEILNLKSLPERISKLKLIEGNFPNSVNEIIIEYQLKDKYSLNQKINEKFKIVGYYENVENRLLNSKIQTFKGYNVSSVNGYTLNKYFENKEYTFANIKLKTNFNTYEKEYNDYIFEKKIDIKNKLNKNSKIKLDEFLSEKYDEINKGKNKIENSKNEIMKNENKIIDAKNKILSAEKNLISKINEFQNANDKFYSSEVEINNQKVKLLEKQYNLKENLSKLEEGLKELEINKNKINNGLNEIEKGFNDIDENQKKIDVSKEEILKNEKYINSLKPSIFVSKTKIEDGKSKIEKAIKEIELGENRLKDELKNLENKKIELINNLSFVENKKNELEENKKKINDGLEQIKLGLDKLEEGNKKLIEEKNKFNEEYEENLSKIIKAKEEIKSRKKEIEKAAKKFEEEKNKANEIIENSLNDLEINRRKLDLLNSIYFINTRIDNPNYSSFIESIESLNIISKLFPVIFYLIVILVSTTTMTRMVDEQRNSIGTYMFLGYSKNEISKKYYIYALLSTILGISLGIYFGIYSMPKFIYTAFKAGSISMYNDLVILFDIKIVLISVVASISSSILSVYLSLRSDFNIEISELLKPKMPKQGSSIFLEKIKIFWNNLSFSNKISLRNIFRYKGKMIMNILGITGCTSLIFLGFAIKNSFSEISELQYNKIRNFHAEVNLKNYLNKNEISNIINLVNKDFNLISLESINAKFSTENRENNIKIYVLDDINVNEFFYLSNKIDDEGILISKRALTLMNKNIGDEILISDFIGNEYNLRVSNTIDNYQGNYIFLTRKFYEKNLQKEYKVNTLIVKENGKSLDYLLDFDEIQSISLNREYKEIFDKISDSLNFIVIFITLLSALLSIVVTYSLLEINVNERQRELATIKVIGFFSKEVSLYIYKEIFILTIVGIILGLFSGKWIHKIVLISMEKTNTVFVENIGYTPYIFSITLTLIFSFISFLLIHRKLKEINMIEALKME
ncbi:FtsX-like permease family protein [Streptobacillus moniliformis]|uniref:FtsX-like permease family protein n=1 Tax=Streptobacillus moniliformis TaxID=34105 RepID=UPI0007E4BD87|nr:FtsX-like permease family protein [Streptobacillus moniliformis]